MCLGFVSCVVCDPCVLASSFQALCVFPANLEGPCTITIADSNASDSYGLGLVTMQTPHAL